MMDCVHGEGVERGAWKRGSVGGRKRMDCVYDEGASRLVTEDSGGWGVGREKTEDGRWKMGLGPKFRRHKDHGARGSSNRQTRGLPHNLNN